MSEDEGVSLLVLGAAGMLGAEVCRLAVAYGGRRVVGVTRRPGRPSEDPWVEGVEWHARDARDADAWRELLDEGAPVVHAALDASAHAPGRAYTEIARAAIESARGTRRRVVFASAHDAWPMSGSAWLEATRAAERAASGAGVDFVAPRFGLIFGEERPLEQAAARALRLTGEGDPGGDSWHERLMPTRVERAAMCVLRCALEPERTGPLDLALTRYIGDAVMWQ